MSEEPRLGAWHVSWSGDEPPAILDQKNRMMASVGLDRPELMLARAGLIAATPELYDSVEAALMVLTAIAKYGDEHSSAAAQDIIPPLESALDGARFLGPITPQVVGGFGTS